MIEILLLYFQDTRQQYLEKISERFFLNIQQNVCLILKLISFKKVL